MTKADEENVKQHLLRLEYPEVDWSTREGETCDGAVARWRFELKQAQRQRLKKTRWRRACDIVRDVAVAMVWIAGVSVAVGGSLAIIRALWRLAAHV